MITIEKLIETIERIKYLAEDFDVNTGLDRPSVDQILQICDDTIIDWKCENAKIGEINETRA